MKYKNCRYCVKKIYSNDTNFSFVVVKSLGNGEVLIGGNRYKEDLMIFHKDENLTCKRHYNCLKKCRILDPNNTKISKKKKYHTRSKIQQTSDAKKTKHEFCIVEIKKLEDLFQNITCSHCSSKMGVSFKKEEAGAVSYDFFCRCEKKKFSWCSSTILKDTSTLVLRKMIHSWYTTGLSDGSFKNFFSTMGIIHSSNTTYQKHIKKIQPMINKHTKEQLDNEIKLLNKKKEVNLSHDNKWDRPQKWGNRAKGTSCNWQDNSTHKIIHTRVAKNNELKDEFGDQVVDEEGKDIFCLEKFSFIESLKYLALVLLIITSICSDGMGNNEKWIHVHLQNFLPIEIYNDIWHFFRKKSKNWYEFIRKKSLVVDPSYDLIKIKQCSRCNSTYNSRKKICDDCNSKDLKEKKIHGKVVECYPNLLNIKFEQFKSHVFHCIKLQKSLAEKKIELLLFPEYLIKKNIKLDQLEVIMLKKYIYQHDIFQNFKNYHKGFSTSSLEGFHSLDNLYIPKGRHYDMENYKSRHNLSILHWNELKEVDQFHLVKDFDILDENEKKILLKREKAQHKLEFRNILFKKYIKLFQ